MMIADGCSSEQYTFLRWYKGSSLSFDNYMVGAIKTYIADSVVPDSAPAASAIATGVRTSDKFISVGPSENTIQPVPRPPKDLQYRPLATVLEGARLLGKSTGIVATSRVSHATPAAFVAHVPVRKMENDIMEQAVYENIDVVFGGGKLQLIPKDSGGKRNDGENLIEVLEQKGYQIVETRGEMMQVDSGKVFGMFAGSHMAAEIDRKQIARAQPTLAEMTEKAIEILSKDPDGFFLMVEGSQVDWACHANDPAHLVSDLLMYDQAVETALDFAKKNGNTLVLAFSDHNTGGFSLGNSMTNDTYSQMKPDALLDPVKKMKASSSLLWKHVGDEKTAEKVRIVVMQDWGIEISDEEAARILTLAEAYKENPNYAFGEVICPRYTYFGWTTHGHVGGDVPLFAFGPAKPAGLLDAPDMGKVAAAAMGLDMDKLNERLFVDTTETIEGAVVAIDKTNAENPILKVEYQGTMAEFPANKNLMRLGNKVTELEGVVVYIPATGKGYLPMQAIRTITGSTEPLPAITE